MKFSDSHLHLDFLDAPSEALALARVAGVKRFVAVGTAAAYFPRLLSWQDTQDVFLALGLHPLYAHQESDLLLLADLLKNKQKSHRIIAIGEIGLNTSKAFQSQLETQRFYFQEQLKLAQYFDLPVLLHSRGALDEVLFLLRKHRVKRFLIHSFTGSNQQLQNLLNMGGKIGIGGTVTYPRAQRLRQQIAQIPPDAYVLETDAPDQPLYGFQGRANLPQRLPLIAHTVAQLRGVAIEKIAAESEQNVRDFFGF